MDIPTRFILVDTPVAEPDLPLFLPDLPDSAAPASAFPASEGPPPALPGDEALPVPPRRLGAMSKLEALGEMALCSSLPTQLVISLALRLAGWSPVDAKGQLTL